MSTQDQGDSNASSEASQPTAAAPPAAIPSTIVAGPGKSYRVRRYLITLMLVGAGIMCIRDGFFIWPNDARDRPYEKPHDHLSIGLNQLLGIILPPWGIFVLVMALYKSRGQYLLQDGVLYVPGHPPVPLDRIQSLGADTWERKGIAEVNYDIAGSPQAANIPTNQQHGRLILDDFIYDQPPTDQIYQAIEQTLVKTLKPAPAYTPPPVAGSPAVSSSNRPTRPATRLPPRPRVS